VPARQLQQELERLRPLAIGKMPLEAPHHAAATSDYHWY
jgi:hypothetical protein